ncbi:MAG TPA: RidA family protein [Candidatus Krumholzibacteria bacterium]|nr:RidA family protein [Candidatus Krumholzibacteria bacterium]
MRILRRPGARRPSGYSEGTEARGRTIFVAGQIATSDDGSVVAGDLAAQVEQALRNVVAVLSAGGAQPAHVVRMTWFVTDMDEYRRERSRIGDAYRLVMGNHYPAMTLVAVTALVDPAARVEIEVTAVLPDDAGK